MVEKMKVNIGILFGGRTVEHEVSIITAHQVIAALDKKKYDPIPLYITKEGQWYSGDVLLNLDNFKNIENLLQQAIPIEISVNYGKKEIFSRKEGMFRKNWKKRIDVAIPVGHGTFMEDGCLQGILEMMGIPYAGPTVLCSAMGMDKIIMKAVFREAGLPIVDYFTFANYQWEKDRLTLIEEIEKKINYPLMIKPINLGSSIGISRVSEREKLIDAVELAFSFSKKIIAEKAVTPLKEINCAVLGTPGKIQFSLCEEPFSVEDILSFSDKYLTSTTKGMGGAKRRLLKDQDEIVKKIKDYSARAFTALDCQGVCRVDFLVNKTTKEIFINEINTIPGSLSFYLFEPAGFSFSYLLEYLISLCLERRREQDKLITVYDSNILIQGGSKGKK